MVDQPKSKNALAPFGTTGLGGDSQCNCGVVLKLGHNSNDTWPYAVSHRFHGTDGSAVVAPLVMDNRSNLYGTAPVGGPDEYGVVFKVTP